jgi:cytochrome c2
MLMGLLGLAVDLGMAWGGVDEGRAIYTAKCKVCHSLAGDAGKMAATGGPLDGVAAKRDEAWIRGYLTDPKSKIPTSKMVKMKMTDQEFNDVVAFMLTLKEAAPAK